jgi:DNA polymerase-3 subunit gamma/tau
MSYLVLARKWRPQSFADVVGQQAVVRTLRNALVRDRVAHAMLFSGVRGVGKTTLARLMAKALNCREGEPDVPCNRCLSCLEIMAGNAVDLQEIDGASNRGIQEIRELKENIRFFPGRDRYKIIIIDEVHMLTTEAFNALLKTLEEPPAHVYFMFATTELHKIPITILSRCQRYELKRVSFADLVAFFARIAQAEQVDISVRALEMIAREAEGSVRDGLSLLDQMLSFGGDAISEEDVVQVLGLVDRRVFENLARTLLAGDLAGCLALFEKSHDAGMDMKRFASDLLGFFRALLVVKAMQRPEDILDVSDEELTALKEIAASSSLQALYLHFDLLLKGIEEMQYSSRPRMALEMAFIRASQAGQVVPVGSLLSRLAALLATDGPKGGEIVMAVDRTIATAEPLQSFAPSASAAATVPVERAQAPAEPEEKPATSLRHGFQGGEDACPAPPPSSSGRDVLRHWEEFVEYVKGRKRWMAHVLHLCSSARVEGSELVLKFADPSDCKVFQEQDNLQLLHKFVKDFFQHEFRVVFTARDSNSAGPGGDDLESPREERRALAGDPLVQMATEVFSGQVASIRLGPRADGAGGKE